ncbi:hypothetical protein [Oceanospirillum sp.]|uniref:hypothetical protein n=1 Tax=Oceanospirillum sp. TaxID=2021254 RepID=UPI003A8C8F19
MRTFLFFLCFAISPYVISDDIENISDGERLIKGCSELIGMYNKIGEEGMLTSISYAQKDTLLAGYCLGVLKAITQSKDYNCRGRGWYRLAEDLANEWRPDMKSLGLRSALGKVCYVR